MASQIITLVKPISNHLFKHFDAFKSSNDLMLNYLLQNNGLNEIVSIEIGNQTAWSAPDLLEQMVCCVSTVNEQIEDTQNCIILSDEPYDGLLYSQSQFKVRYDIHLFSKKKALECLLNITIRTARHYNNGKETVGYVMVFELTNDTNTPLTEQQIDEMKTIIHHQFNLQQMTRLYSDLSFMTGHSEIEMEKIQKCCQANDMNMNVFVYGLASAFGNKDVYKEYVDTYNLLQKQKINTAQMARTQMILLMKSK